MAKTDPLRVVLVSLNVDKHYSLAFGYLKLFALRDEVLRSRTIISTIQQTIKRSTNWLVISILARRPQVVGFSCNVWNIRRVLKVAHKLKRMAPSISILFGGQEMTHSTIDYMALCPDVDVIVDGEGEETFRLLLRAWLEDQWMNLRAIPGISFRQNDKVVVNPPAALIEQLDSIPSPYLEGQLVPPANAPLGLMIETSRGCRFHCAFCFEGTRYPRVRSFSLDRIEKEIAWAASQGIRSFHILDPVLGNADLARLRALHGIIRKHIVPRGPYSISVEVHAEVLYEEMALLLEDFTLFDIGLQSICPEALRHLRRGFNRTRFLRGVELLKKLNRHTNLYLILGLPGETFFSFLLGVQFCVDRNVSRLFINHLCVLNGTALREDAVALKLHYKCTPPYTAQSSYSFSAGEMDLARVFADTIVREHDALALAPHGILLEQ